MRGNWSCHRRPLRRGGERHSPKNTPKFRTAPTRKAPIAMLDPVESWRWPLALILLAANVAVWLGVYWEGEQFSEETKETGWRLLLRGLAIETAVAFLLFTIDTSVQTRSDATITDLTGRAAQLSKDAEAEKAKVAAANERTANLEKETAQIRRDNLSLQKQVADAQEAAADAQAQEKRLRITVTWRSFTLFGLTRLANLLASGAGGSVTIAWQQGDVESTMFALQIIDAFKLANKQTPKWKIDLQPRLSYAAVAFGMFVPGPDNASVSQIRGAFTAIGLPFSTSPAPYAGTQVGGIFVGAPALTTNALIMVGAKPMLPDASVLDFLKREEEQENKH